MKKLKIIQLASFRGNLGDNANVVGTRRMLERNLDCEIEYTDLEYLEYEPDPRWGGKKFDLAFVDLVNRHDLLLIGGGGFFELAVDSSCSGTPLDIPEEIIDQIRVPIVFYALGFHVLYGLTPERKEKFRRYLDMLFSKKHVLVSMRNDGSVETVRQLYGDAYADRIHRCPDGGFFTTPRDFYHPEQPAGKKYIALQLAGDGETHRFPKPGGANDFLKQTAEVFRQIFRHTDLQAVLIPHIPEDMEIINRFLVELGPPYSRRNVTVAPYLHGQQAQDYIFDLYSKAELAVGMRFHANVSVIGLNVPTIGIATYDQIDKLYRELGMPERAVRPDAPSYGQKLIRLIGDSLTDRPRIIDRYRQLNEDLARQVTEFHGVLENFIGRKRILINTQFHWPYAPADYSLAMGLQQRGHEVLMLACGGGLPHYCELQTNRQKRPECSNCLQNLAGYFQKYGLPYATVRQFLQKEDYVLADRLTRECSVDQLLRYELHGVPVGKLARLNLFQYYHGFPFEIEGEKEETFRRAFHSAVLYTLAKKRLFDSYRPDLVVTTNGKFLQWAPLVYFARQAGCDYVTWEDLDQAPSGIGLARNGIAHEQRIDEVWESESRKEMTEEKREELKKHFRLWANGEVSVFKYYDDDTEFNPDAIARRLNLRPGRPRISLFCNVSWDSSSVGFEGAFESMYDWIFSCVEYAAGHPEVDLIVRTHPAEIKVPDAFKNEVLTCDVIRRRFSHLPENIKLIEPDSSISSYAVADMSDVCMVYTSTMGIELALQGRKVWTAANAYYAGKGFTLDLQSREHMVEMLGQRPLDGRLTPEQIGLAEKFAHIVRLRRVFSVPYLETPKDRFHFPGRQAYAPAGNAVIDRMCSYVLTGRPFLDIGTGPEAKTQEISTMKPQDVSRIQFGQLTIQYDHLPALQTELKTIFEQKIYDFRTDKSSPLVIDGGAHLGLFSLYVKRKYPAARILAFEPDDRAFAHLQANLAVNRVEGVQSIQSGLYNQNTTLRFAGDGADGGAIQSDGAQSIRVVKLSEYIKEEVDFLKLNIEGAELEVLEEIEPKLPMIRELCLEYHGFPNIGQRLHRILDLLDRNGFRYLIHDFDHQTNPATKPPFSIDAKTRFFLLVYARRISTRPQRIEPSAPHLRQPVSRKFGFDRGTPIDRVLIEAFLAQHRQAIRGSVLEVGESVYTKKFGCGVKELNVLHPEPGNPQATLVGNLETGENIPEKQFDCIILTQTLQMIYNCQSVIQNCYKALKDNGVLLLTAPGISQISRYDMDRWGDYWRFTTLSLKKLLGESFGGKNVEAASFGNYHLAAEFLNGRSAEEIAPEAFSANDEDYQLLLGAAAVRRERTGSWDASREVRPVPAVRNADRVPPSPLVLLYHRVADEPLDSQLLAVSPDAFRQHLEVLKAAYRVVSLRQLLGEAMHGGGAPNTVALTFDDGYRDNLTHALPLLEEYGMHATVFVTAGPVERTRGFWWDRLENLLLGGHPLPADLELSEDGQDYRWRLDTPEGRLHAYDQMASLLRRRPASEIEAFVDELFRWAQVEETAGLYKPVLNRSELERLSRSPWIEIGAHTMTHSLLSCLSPQEQAVEIVACRQKLESWIQKPVTLLSYPFGSRGDYTPVTGAIARQAGFHYAIANIQGSVPVPPEPYEVPRRLVRNWSGEAFARWMRTDHKNELEEAACLRRREAILQAMKTPVSPSANRRIQKSAP